MLITIGVTAFLAGTGTGSGATTEVGGLIDTDTSWTLENSPYIVTTNVLVREDATLGDY